MNKTDTVFVYGTLKSNQLRSRLWPHPPLEIRPAVIRASLYDLGPYPAIGPGEDYVLGEAWKLLEEHVLPTLEILDQVEGYHALGEDNEYLRIRAELIYEDGSVGEAFTYQFAAKDRLAHFRRIVPDTYFRDLLSAAWPDRQSRVPRSFEEE
jgi:gamma-glutamylcyclotransferase (GGCT)/AIG2-like uncharacterized protein YtfP